MAWYRYRERWAHGIGDWEYIFVDPKEMGYADLGEYLSETNQINNWSDKWRGVDIQTISKPPKKVLQEKIDSLKYHMEAMQEELDYHISKQEKWYK